MLTLNSSINIYTVQVKINLRSYTHETKPFVDTLCFSTKVFSMLVFSASANSSASFYINTSHFITSNYWQIAQLMQTDCMMHAPLLFPEAKIITVSILRLVFMKEVGHFVPKC